MSVTGIQRDEYSWQPCMTGEESYNQMFTGLKLTLDMIFVEWAQGTNRPSHVFRKGTSSMSFSICDNIKDIVSVQTVLQSMRQMAMQAEAYILPTVL